MTSIVVVAVVVYEIEVLLQLKCFRLQSPVTQY